MNKIDKIENQNNSDSNQFGKISTSEFLSFLKLACHVHESIILKNESAAALDYNALAKNELVNSLINLKSSSSPKSSGAEENGGSEKNGKYFTRGTFKLNSTNCSLFFLFRRKSAN